MNRGFIGALCLSVTFTLLAGCRGSAPPTGAPGAMPQSHAVAQHTTLEKSWMLPAASSEDLLYVGAYDQSYQKSEVFVLSYASQQVVGELSGIGSAEGLCADAAGNVYVTDNGNSPEVHEFRHGGQPKRVISMPRPPAGCAVDQMSGDLAITTEEPGFLSQLYVYKHARGTPKTYSTSHIGRLFACTYDASGNLFVIGYNQGSSDRNYKIAELPRGKKKLQLINAHDVGSTFTDVKWDGQYLALLQEGTIYRVSVDNGKLTVEGTASVSPFGYQFWPVSKYSQVVETAQEYVFYYSYPAGSKIGSVNVGPGAYGVTVSLAPHRQSPRSK